MIRSYAIIADELEAAGYTQKEIDYIKGRVNFYLKLREEIKIASNETLDMKTYEADMRHLIDTYIQAKESRIISNFENTSLMDLIDNLGIEKAINSLPEGIKGNKEAVAETIENNVRKKIIKEHLLDPAYFDEISKLLYEIIRERREKAISYEEYLKRIAELSMKASNTIRADLPPNIKTNAQRALYHNLDKNEALAVVLDNAIKRIKKADWRGNSSKENEIKAELYKILKDKNEVERIFPIIKQQNDY